MSEEIVHDPQHRPIAGAEVKLKSATSDWTSSAQTDQDGAFQFVAVTVGEYLITVSCAGFQDAAQRTVIQSGSSSILHIPPGANRTNSLAMITDYVPGAYIVHDQLHIRGGHQVSWLVDSVPVPNTSITSNIGPQFDPKDVDYLEVQRGGYAADYGDRTLYGSFNQTNDQISLDGHTSRFAYYASFNGNRSDYGLETPIEPIFHDMDNGFGGFGSFIFNATPNDQLRLVTSLRRDFYQVPNTANQ